MEDDLIDDRPEIEPDFYMYEPLSPDGPRPIMLEKMRTNGAHAARMTLVSPAYPKPPYPDGYYLEGWRVDPAKMDPPGKQAPFNFPLTASEG